MCYEKSGLIAVLLTLGICFSGCYQNEPMYEQEDADRVAVQGAEMLKYDYYCLDGEEYSSQKDILVRKK